MATEEISSEIYQFIRSYIDSVEQLDVLLLIYQEQETLWTPELIAKRLRNNENSAKNRVTTLMRHKILSFAPATGSYSIDKENKKLIMLLEQLANLYKTHKYRMISFIFTKNDQPLVDFAEAFRLKKDPKDG